MQGFASIRKISSRKKPIKLKISAGNEEAPPQEQAEQIGKTEKQKPAREPSKAISQREINLGFRPSSQVHSGKIIDPYCLPQKEDHEWPDRKSDAQKKQGEPKLPPPVCKFADFQFVSLQ